MRRSILTLALCLALPLASHAAQDLDKVNGAIRVEAGQQVGDASTVNGAIRIEDGAAVQDVSTVNGAVALGERAQARSVDTVNGAVTLAAGARVAGKVEAVNGGIRLDHGAEIGGRASNVNGSITLDAAHVAGGLETVAGDITVGADSRVEGGLLVDKPGGMFHWGKSRTPHVVIGPRAVVQGTLEFRRDVVLEVSDSAQIGPVKGATPVKFSGETP